MSVKRFARQVGGERLIWQPVENPSKEILERHLTVGREKPVSYLPMRTIENLIGISVDAYTELITNMGNQYAIFDSGRCCIQSGAVYAFSSPDLAQVLNEHSHLLSAQGWPLVPIDFIERIASEWLDPADPIMVVIKQSFGER